MQKRLLRQAFFVVTEKGVSSLSIFYVLHKRRILSM